MAGAAHFELRKCLQACRVKNLPVLPARRQLRPGHHVSVLEPRTVAALAAYAHLIQPGACRAWGVVRGVAGEALLHLLDLHIASVALDPALRLVAVATPRHRLAAHE